MRLMPPLGRQKFGSLIWTARLAVHWFTEREGEQWMKTSVLAIREHPASRPIRDNVCVVRVPWNGTNRLHSAAMPHEPTTTRLNRSEVNKHMGKGNKSGRRAMRQRAASRIQSAGARHPRSPTAKSGFGPRAQSAAAHNGSQGGQA